MSAVELLITGRSRDLGEGFVVRRVLPATNRMMVGPFIFFDHMGPTHFAPGPAINVRPHPHVALATVTYLFDGEILHRDSLGYAQEIYPGDLNWMIAGRGIVHSERTTPRSLREGVFLNGIQSWVALPDGHEDDAPQFTHHPRSTLPVIERSGSRLRVLAGEAFGRRSPAQVVWPTLYVDAQLEAGAAIEIDGQYEERGIYVADGEVIADGETIGAGVLAILRSDASVKIASNAASRCILLGGSKFPTPRIISWNFVASTAERLERARRDWRDRELTRFPVVPGDEHEFIPLP